MASTMVPRIDDGRYREKHTENTVDAQLTDIQSFYDGSRVFITGGTGFMGKVLLAKLLGSCPGIEKIYLLIREKKEQSASDRLKNMLNNEIFDSAKRACPDYWSRLAVIAGDCERIGLGLKQDDRDELCNEVTVVFNCAATINFDETLKYATNMNVRCTDQMIELAKTMKKLRSFVHVSTAFSYCIGRADIAEKHYEPPISPQKLMELVDELDEDSLKRITPELLGDYPNTYVYTKAVAEEICHQKTSGIPLAIFRPSIIVSSAKEPVAGFAGNAAGPMGLSAALAVGLMRTLYCKGDYIVDVVPCDYAVNAAIAVAKATADNWEKNSYKATNPSEVSNRLPTIYNYTSSGTKSKIKWKEFIGYGLDIDLAYNHAIWMTFLIITSNRFLYQMYALILHTLPAFIMDSVGLFFGQKPRIRKYYGKIHKAIDMLSFFTLRQWYISNENVQLLWESMSLEDRRRFRFSLNEFDWKRYMEDYTRGLNKYILGEKPSDVAYNRSKKTTLKIVHYTFVTVLFAFIFYISFIGIKWSTGFRLICSEVC